MFDGVPEQFHQFIASRTPQLPLPLSFPLHGSSSPPFTNFDPYILHHLQPQSQTHVNIHVDKEENNSTIISTNLELERERSVSHQIDPWSNDEVLALLRIRSSMENWFPDLIWEHVSRKLAELGFKRSAEKCKEKFEEETGNFNTISYNNKQNQRIFSELEQLYHGRENNNQNAENVQSNTEEDDNIGQSFEKDAKHTNPCQENEQIVVMMEKTTKVGNKRRKREKRSNKVEMFKGFCVEIVNKMMAQQEELHKKLLEDIVNRDEVKIAKHEAWKQEEMERVNKEIEMREHEQAITCDRQATIIEFLNKFTTSTFSSLDQCTTSPLLPQNNTSSTCHDLSTNTIIPKIPMSSSPSNNSSIIHTNPLAPQKAQNYEKGDDTGRRWPKDEVLALINIRASFNGSNDQEKEGAKCSLWERISQGMMELGYKRSAKRCKEKWENINKYFRKTKDVNKKRSLDSRTCPYFHQLSSLYNQGTLVAPPNASENSPENHSTVPENSSSDGGKDVVTQAPAFNFEF